MKINKKIIFIIIITFIVAYQWSTTPAYGETETYTVTITIHRIRKIDPIENPLLLEGEADWSYKIYVFDYSNSKWVEKASFDCPSNKDDITIDTSHTFTYVGTPIRFKIHLYERDAYGNEDADISSRSNDYIYLGIFYPETGTLSGDAFVRDGEWYKISGESDGSTQTDENDAELWFKIVAVRAVGSLKINIYNVGGLKLPIAGGTIHVKLYDSSNQLVKEENKPFSGGEPYVQVSFTDLKIGTYSIMVYQTPNTGLGLKEYWGKIDQLTVEPNTEKTYNFYRNMPYVSAGPSYTPSPGLVGTPMNIEVKVKNPGSKTVDVKVRLIIDKDKKSPWDADLVYPSYKTINPGVEATFSFSWTPQQDGIYYPYVIVYTREDIVTDQSVWPIEINVITKGYIKVTVANNDDDPHKAKIYIDGELWMETPTINPGSSYTTSSKEVPGNAYHNVKIEWFDDDTKTTYSQTQNIYVYPNKESIASLSITRYLSTLTITVVRNDLVTTVEEAKIELYTYNWQLIKVGYTDKNGKASFTDLTDGSYNIKVFYRGGSELWGWMTDITVGNIGKVEKTFKQYLPNCWGQPINVPGSIYLGSSITISITTKNSDINNDWKVKLQIIFDKDQQSPWDHEGWTEEKTITKNGGIQTFTYTWTPREAGTYYLWYKVYTYIPSEGGWKPTDQWPFGLKTNVITATLTVIAKDRSGNPIPNALIILYSIQGSTWTMKDKRETDTQGKAIFTGLTIGKYAADLRIYHNLQNQDYGICIGGIGEFDLKADDTKTATASDYPAKLTVKVYYSDGKTLLHNAIVKLSFPIGYENDPAFTTLEKTAPDGTAILNMLPRKWWYYGSYNDIEYRAEIYHEGKKIGEKQFKLTSFDHIESITTTLNKEKIIFSGYEWTIKSLETSKEYPGPNYWSEKNVWVDENGWLHLKITYRDGKWYCAEVYTTNPLGYGTYIFYVASKIDNLDKNVVVGLFAYKDDEHEVDIEFAKWGDATAKNAWYTVQPQPYTEDKNQKSFNIKLTDTYSTHWFTWSNNFIYFESFHGHYPYDSPPESNIIQSWLCSLKREATQARAHINLWLLKGNPPSDGKEVEIIIKEFKFYPNLIPPRPMPDLVIENIWTEPQDLFAGQPFTLKVKVKNQGGIDITNPFQLVLSIDNLYNSTEVKNVNGLKAGSTVEISWEGVKDRHINLALTTGKHTLKVIVDSSNNVIETSETNNEKTLTVNVYKAKWTVLAYICGDNNLEEAADDFFGKLHRVGSTSSVNIIALLDKRGEKDSLIWYILKQSILGAKNYYVLADNFEANMGSKDCLKALLSYAKTFEAERYMLWIYNHGNGTHIPQEDEHPQDGLSITELRDALRESNVIIDILFLDACLTQNIETLVEVKDQVKILIGSQELSPVRIFSIFTDAGPVNDIIGYIVDEPNINSWSLAKRIVDRIADWAPQLLCTYYAYSAIDVTKFVESGVIESLRKLSSILIERNKFVKEDIHKLLIKAEMYDDVRYRYQSQNPPKDLGIFTDLYNFTGLLSSINDSEISKAAIDVITKYLDFVGEGGIYMRNSSQHINSHGISIALPLDTLNWHFLFQEWREKLRFNSETRWYDFLKSYFEYFNIEVILSDGSVKNAKYCLFENIDGKWELVKEVYGDNKAIFYDIIRSNRAYMVKVYQYNILLSESEPFYLLWHGWYYSSGNLEDVKPIVTKYLKLPSKVAVNVYISDINNHAIDGLTVYLRSSSGDVIEYKDSVNGKVSFDVWPVCSGEEYYLIEVKTPHKLSQEEKYTFMKWDDDIKSSSRVIKPTQDIILKAYYKLQYYLKVESPYDTPMGEGWYDEGSNAYASLNKGVVEGYGVYYIFSKWVDANSGEEFGTNWKMSNPIPMNKPRTIKAVWDTYYRLNINTNPSIPIDIKVADLTPPTTTYTGKGSFSNIFKEGASVTITIPIEYIHGDSKYTFKNWSGDATGTNPSILITMNSPKNIVANFDAYHRVVLKTMPEGLPLPSINPPSSDGFYKEGTIVTLIAANITGYRFVKWYVNNVEKGIGQTSITLTIDKPLTIAAVYEKLLPDIIVKCTPNDVKVNESENISIQVEVSNIGEVSTGPFNVIGNIKRDNIIILPQQDISINPWPISFIIPNLNPGETIKLQLTVSRLPSGEYTLEIIADPENKLPEKREDNNICTCNITVFYIARFESHCLIENKYVTTTIIVNGKTYTTPIELKLIGENKVVATEKDSLGHPFLIWLKDNMDYSSNREITISKAGKYTIIYGEKNKPNIKVNISWTPIEPIAGETIQFNLKIINEGSIQASIFNFTYGVNNIKLGELKINGLMANETFTWSFNYTANTNFTIWAYADPYNSIEEISKIDNKIEKRVDIWVPYTPKPEEIQLTIDLKDKRTCINITMALTNYTYRIVKWGEISKVNNTFTCNMIIERYTLPTYKITKLEHTYELDIPIDGQYIFNLNVKDTLIKSKTFIIDRTPPLISVFYPSNNSHIKISRTVNIWINGTIIELNKGSSKPLINDTRFTLTTWVPSSGSFAFKNNTSIPSGPITINISFTDEHGNTASTTIQFTITQNTPPKPIITYTPSAPLVNQTIVFNASSSIDPDGKITSFEWRFDDNTTASGAITNHSYTKPGTYKVSLKIVDDDYATSETSIEITIYNAIVYLPKISAYPKSNIIIPITIYARNLGAYDLNITFNPSTISVTNVIGGEKPFDTPIWKIDPKGYVKINQFIPTTQGPTGNITVAYLNITVTDEPNKHSELYTQITSLINAATGSEITPRTALNGSINTLEYISLKVAVKFNIDIIDEHVVLNAYLNSTETLEGGLGAYMIKIRVNPKTILINTREGITPFSIPPIANKVNDTIIITSFISEKKGPQMENFKLFGVIIRFNSSVNEKVIFNIENLTLVSAYTGKEYRSKIVFTPLTFIRGDANNDGKVNIADAMFIAQYLAGNRPASDLNLLNAASVKHDDENGDKVSIADAMFIAQYLAGLRDEYMNLKGGG